jgi:hypothetical protein
MSMSAISVPRPNLSFARGQALGFASELLLSQGVSPTAAGSAARALALLLERSSVGSLSSTGNDPVVISGLEAARLCGFDPRTWWLARKRLLELGHLVASAGGGPPQGRSGGRGHKAAYSVAPETRERFREVQSGNSDGSSVMASVMTPPETVNASVMRSDHRLSPSFSKRNTSDVLKILEGRTVPTPTPSAPSTAARDHAEINCERAVSERELLELFKTEPSARVRAAIMRVLAKVITRDRGSRGHDALQSETMKARPELQTETVNARQTQQPASSSASTTRRKRPRSAEPLWAAEDSEARLVAEKVRAILTWANQDFGASFDIDRSSRDTFRYPFLVVRAAVANVLLKRARGYRFENPGAVLWEAITLEGYKLDEFSVARFDEVLARCGEARPMEEVRAPPAPPPPSPPSPQKENAATFERERKRREELQALYESLPEETRHELDARALALAQKSSASAGSSISSTILSLRTLSRRNELLERLFTEQTGTSGPPEEPQFWKTESPPRRA